MLFKEINELENNVLPKNIYKGAFNILNEVNLYKSEATSLNIF